ncbi:SusC/RagA family TonB-linked outer membrane protein [Tenacibaculum retecalamus]|uniref:SusC/RagA family TonB-linked outer membrane protein n=1 Tax=Tenacibaculum retecalamus TaxID=3018315 RepID=UPI0023D92F07|nr:TonB-dependent receptor [Tenacibaculum retecalamus]WBX71893.1 TonB-dependent receptor [Tenacibaculum retecalamus]
MKTKFNGILTLLLALVVQISFAQDKTISGTVSDESGSLPGVTVLKKGTTIGTETDFDGNYSIKAKTGDVLVFSFVGMKTTERTVGSSNNISFIMEGNNLLDEVIVVAYGTQNKKSVVGAITVVSSDVIENQQVASVTSALQGSVPGVNIISAGGQPGDNATIRIRGIGSINASAEPLVILDGAPFNGNINTISADQVESMTVLKDASSTSLYGSRGANGVIIITTKKGRINSPTTISLRSTMGVSSNAVKRHKLTSTDTFTEYTWEAMRNNFQYEDGESAAAAAARATDQLIPTLQYNPYGINNPVGLDGKLVSTDKLWNTNWIDHLENDAAVRKEHNLSVSGGSENTTYIFSANYLNQEGSIKTSNFERVATRINIDSKINDWLNTGLNLSYSTSTQNYPSQSGTSFTSIIQWINNVSSFYPVYRRDANGQLILDPKGNKLYDYGDAGGQPVNATRPLFNSENTVGSLYNYVTNYKRDNITANTYAKINFNENLSFKTQFSYEKYLYDSYQYVHNEYGYAASVGGRVSQDRDFVTTKNIINSINYKNTFNDHSINVDVIHEAFERTNDNLGAQGVGYLPNVRVLNGSTTPESVSGSFTDETLVSYLGRVGYSFKDKYFLEGSFRTDGSSKFDQDVRWGNFYSIGGSWVISDEKFLAESNTVNFLKLRASFGELGNNRGIGYFPYLAVFETGFNELTNTGVVSGGVTDPILTWEKSRLSNIGLDFRLFNNIIDGSVEYYNKESIDLIYDKPLASSTGNTSIRTNTGSIKNSGIEVILNADIINKNDFSWSAGLNFSFDKNEITELTQESFINGSKRWEVGKSIYEFYLREWAGVDPATGYGLWYKDVVDGSGNPTGERIKSDDYATATRYYSDKSSLPDVIGGLRNTLKYRDFDLNILMNFSYGAYVYDSSYASLMSGMSRVGQPGSVDLIDRWQKPGDETDIPLLLASQNDFSSSSDRFLFKNNYLRLKALTLGYTIPSNVINSTGLSKARLYFQADNLLTFQSHEGIDPEQSLSGTTNNRSFNQRILSFGVNLEF